MRKLKKMVIFAGMLFALTHPAKSQPKIEQSISFSTKNYLENPLSSTWGTIYGGKYSLEKTYDKIRPKINFEKYHKKSNIGSMQPETDIYGISAGIDLLFSPKKFTPYVGFELNKYKNIYTFKNQDKKSNLSYPSNGASLKAGLELKLKETKIFLEGQTQIAITKSNLDINLNNNTFSLGIRF